MNISSQKKSPGEVMNEIYSMPEYKLWQRLQAFNTSIYIFDKNFTELRDLITFLLNDPNSETFRGIRNEDKLRKLQIDIIRRLHNFVAASLSLIDHTRNLYEKLYFGNNRFPEYQARIDNEFVKDSLSQFVKCLRQYCQHYRPPDIGFYVSVSNTEEGMIERKKIILLLEDLKTFDSWNSAAKKYMNSQKEYIDILEVTTCYQEKVMVFYQWFQSRQTEIHSDELKLFKIKQTELTLLILEGRVNACLNNKQDMPYRLEELFEGIFLSDDFEAIEKLPFASPDRSILSMNILEKYYNIPDKLSEKIIRLYREPGFLEPRK